MIRKTETVLTETSLYYDAQLCFSEYILPEIGIHVKRFKEVNFSKNQRKFT
jgi:hypothetical protein